MASSSLSWSTSKKADSPNFVTVVNLKSKHKFTQTTREYSTIWAHFLTFNPTSSTDLNTSYHNQNNKHSGSFFKKFTISLLREKIKKQHLQRQWNRLRMSVRQQALKICIGISALAHRAEDIKIVMLSTNHQSRRWRLLKVLKQDKTKTKLLKNQPTSYKIEYLVFPILEQSPTINDHLQLAHVKTPNNLMKNHHCQFSKILPPKWVTATLNLNWKGSRWTLQQPTHPVNHTIITADMMLRNIVVWAIRGYHSSRHHRKIRREPCQK